MTSTPHDLERVALRQLETALCLYFEQQDYYSVITLAGASEEVLGAHLRARLKTEVRRYCEHEDFYLMITSAHDSKRIVDALLKTFDENDKACADIWERFQNEKLCDELLGRLQEDESPEQLQNKPLKMLQCKLLQILQDRLLEGLQGKLQQTHKKEITGLRKVNEITKKHLKELEKASGETNDRRKDCLTDLKGIFDSSKSYLDSMIDDASEIEWTMFDVTVPTAKGLLREANWLKNMLKHGSFCDTKVVEFDAREWAKDMLRRAIDNYYSLTYNLTPAMRRFQEMHVQDNAVVRDW